jgi:hypothetical protein
VSEVIEVRDVIEKNDCAGKKSFFVTSMGSDESVKSIYQLNSAWMPPESKLELSAVAPLDRVAVVQSLYTPLIVQHDGELVALAGEFIQNHSDPHLRDPVCRCGQRLKSDGFDIHCPDPYCPLSIVMRLQRLAETQFFDFESVTSDGELVHFHLTDEDFNQYTRPFFTVTQSLLWGRPGGLIEDYLLTRPLERPNQATFLIPDLFEDFLENPAIPMHLGQVAVSSIQRFYGWMNETVNRRDFNSHAQNRLLYGFLQSLAIEALRPQFIEAIFTYEAQVGFTDPVMIYAHILTNVNELVKEIGMHPLEAQAIIREIYQRRYEMHDIFRCYALNKSDVDTTFSKFDRIAG